MFIAKNYTPEEEGGGVLLEGGGGALLEGNALLDGGIELEASDSWIQLRVSCIFRNFANRLFFSVCVNPINS